MHFKNFDALFIFLHNAIIQKKQYIFAWAAIIALFGFMVFGQRFGLLPIWLLRRTVDIPLSGPYAEGRVVRNEAGVIWAERIFEIAPGASERRIQKNLEILVNDKTVFAKREPPGKTVRIAQNAVAAGSRIAVYIAPRPAGYEEDIPVPPELGVPFEEISSNPRERILAVFVVVMSEE